MSSKQHKRRHLDLVAKALAAIANVFSDTSVDRSTTRKSLEDIRDVVDGRLDTLTDEPDELEE